MNKRIALKQFRVGVQLTQQEMSDKLGVSRSTYIAIENGSRNGTVDFWRTFQKEFDVPDADMWKLQKQNEQE